jgi:serine/threonine-protein phosphatase 2A regulatory subunit B''
VGEKALSDGVLGFRGRGKQHDKPSPQTTGLTYSDFIYLILSDMDKTSVVSLQYWFRCFDIDGNGVLTQPVLERMYKNQHDRLVAANKGSKGRIEVVGTDQMLEYLLDQLNPANRQAITIQDFTTYSDQLLDGGHFFNALSNVVQFAAHEELSREALKHRQETFLAGTGLSDWDRFAAHKYEHYSKTMK